ncbi:MAG: FadR/GntR family transcriptional regulator [Desulfosudaceae bacterium]
MTIPLPDMPVAINRKRLHEEIVLFVQHRILTGEWPHGDKMPTERELATMFGVNRGTVREALRKLEALELIDIRHGDGVYVKDYLESGNLELIRPLLYLRGLPGVDVVDNILELRRLMVPEMAAGAAKKRTEAHLADLKAVISDPALSMKDKDIRLHHIIARASHNILYVIVLNFFYRLSGEVIASYFDNPETTERTCRFHADIYNAIKNQHPVKAKKIMNDILAYAEEKIRKTME